MHKRRVLITGAGGQLGRALQSAAADQWELLPYSSVELDIRDWRKVRDTGIPARYWARERDGWVEKARS